MLRYTQIACLYFHQQYTRPTFHPILTISGFSIHWMTKNYHKIIFWCSNILNTFRRRGTANALRAGRFAVRIPAEIEDVLFLESFMSPLGLPILLLNRYRRYISRVKRPGRMTTHLQLLPRLRMSGAIPLPPPLIWLHSVDRNSFAFTLNALHNDGWRSLYRSRRGTWRRIGHPKKRC